MRKIMKLCVCGLAAAMLISGCTKETDSDGTITLGQYKGVEVEVLASEVTDAELEDNIQSALLANPDYTEITDRAAELGDIVNIDYAGMKDGVAFEGGTAQRQDLTLGSNSFIEGFEAGLVGAKIGEKKSLNLTFPEGYQDADLAGAEVVFDVTIHGIKVKTNAVLDDAFVQKISQHKTVEEYRVATKGELLASKTAEIRSKKEYDAIMVVVANSEIICSEEAIQKQFDQQQEYYTSMVQGYGMTLEDYASIFGMDMETFNAQIREAAEDTVKRKLVVKAVAKEEKMKIADADRQAVADQYGLELSALIDDAGKEAVDEDALMTKVITLIADHAVEKPVTEETETTVAETTVAETTAAETTAAETTATAADAEAAATGAEAAANGAAAAVTTEAAAVDAETAAKETTKAAQ